MKIFQSTQKNYLFLGISPIQSNQKHLFNARNTAFSIMFKTSVSFCFVYLIHVARTFGEYLQCAYIMLALMSGTCAFITIIWKMAKLFEFIDSLEEIVNKSECRLDKKRQLKLF